MQLYAYLYSSYTGTVTFIKKCPPFSFITIIPSIMRVLLFIILTLGFTNAHAQQTQLQATSPSSHAEQLSAVDLLKKAKSLRDVDQQICIKLATEALLIAKSNNNHRVSAQAHTLLGKVNKKSNHIEQSLTHFLQASLIYQKTQDHRNQIMSSLDYIDVLLGEKRYQQADTFIDELLPVALEYADAWPIALTFITKGDGYYKQKRYSDSIAQYTQSLEYLAGEDKAAKKHLAQAYKKIAQTYKRLKNREKNAYFYKKALQVYTDLNDQMSMARMLNALAEAERYLGHLVLALDYSLRGLELHKQLDDPESYVESLMGAGIIYRNLGRYEESLNRIHEAHVYYKKINDTNGTAETSNQLGLIYTRLKQFDQARSFYQLSIDLPENTIKQRTLASALRELAVIGIQSKDYRSAMSMAKKAHAIYQKEKDKLKESITARIIASIYHAQKDDDNAISYYKEALRLATETNNKVYTIKAQVPLAAILMGKNTEAAIKRLKMSLQLATEINDKDLTLMIYRHFRQAEKLRGNIAKSLSYAEKEISLTNVIQNEKNASKLTLAKANLHSYKMEVELESLREKAKLDQLELAKKNNKIEIAEQSKTITELELIKNKYASITLSLLLAICVVLVVFIYRRFVASKKRNRELDYLAARDPLTNSYNRRILFERLEQDFLNIELLDQYCMIMVDIDHFKEVNDTYGHTSGDSVLRSVANILQACVRQNDIVARFGGEEFCIVLHRVSLDQAMRIAETMRYKVESHRFGDISVTCSFGVTSIVFNAATPAELIDQADIALYKSKYFGRNQVTLWDPSFKKSS